MSTYARDLQIPYPPQDHNGERVEERGYDGAMEKVAPGVVEAE